MYITKRRALSLTYDLTCALLSIYGASAMLLYRGIAAAVLPRIPGIDRKIVNNNPAIKQRARKAPARDIIMGHEQYCTDLDGTRTARGKRSYPEFS